MLTNEREHKICKKYSARDDAGNIHCWECPLKKGNFEQHDFRCKANSHYDRKTRDWEYDDDEIRSIAIRTARWDSS